MLIRSISGIRGLIDKDLKNDSIIKYANALNELFPEGVISQVEIVDHRGKILFK